MSSVNLTQSLYDEAQRRAQAAGFGSVEDYISQLLREEFAEEPENLDHRFTPEVIAELDQIAADDNPANIFSADQVEERLNKVRTEWLKNNAR